MTKHLFNKVMHSVSLRRLPPRAQGRQAAGEASPRFSSGHSREGMEKGGIRAERLLRPERTPHPPSPKTSPPTGAPAAPSPSIGKPPQSRNPGQPTSPPQASISLWVKPHRAAVRIQPVNVPKALRTGNIRHMFPYCSINDYYHLSISALAMKSSGLHPPLDK